MILFNITEIFSLLWSDSPTEGVLFALRVRPKSYIHYILQNLASPYLSNIIISSCPSLSSLYSHRPSHKNLFQIHFTYFSFSGVASPNHTSPHALASFLALGLYPKLSFCIRPSLATLSKFLWLLCHYFFFFLIYLQKYFFLICSGFCHTLKWNSHGFTCVHFFFFKKILFIWLRQVLAMACRIFDLHCGTQDILVVAYELLVSACGI